MGSIPASTDLVQEGWIGDRELYLSDQLGGHVLGFVNVVRDVRLATEQAEPTVKLEESGGS